MPLLAAVEDAQRLLWTARRKPLEAFMLPACVLPGGVLLGRDASLCALFRVDGARAMTGAAELDRFVEAGTRALTSRFLERGHALHVVLERAPDEAGLAVFDPLSLKDAPLPHEPPPDGGPVPTAEMRAAAQPYLDSQIVATDLQLIDQADLVIVSYPTDKVSPGVFTEMSHARDRRTPIYLCGFPGAPGDASPFLGLFPTRAFRSADELIEAIRRE